VHHSICNPPPYETISYTWGNPSKVGLLRVQPSSQACSFWLLQLLCLVVLNSKWLQTAAVFYIVVVGLCHFNQPSSRARWLPTTANVRDILGERASVFVVKYIWIDSICINQADDAEKGKQVKQMQKIYSNATQTTICLGHTPRAATAHGFLSEIVRRILVPQNVNLTSAMPIKEDNSKFVALKELILHPYWFRAWIVREIAASKNIRVLYGRQFVDWEAFMLCIKSLNSVESGSMIQVLDSSGGPATLPFAALAQVNMLNILRRHYQDEKKLPILNILISCPVVRATNPCDRIFAL
jgi:hypothetical protein